MTKQFPFPQTRTNRLLFGIFLLALIYLSRDSAPCATFLGFYASQFLLLGILVLLAAAFLAANRGTLREVFLDSRMMILAVLTLVFLLPMLAKRDWQLMYFSVLLPAALGICLTYFVSCRRTAKYYVLIITGLAAYSLVAFLVLRPLTEAGLLHPRVVYNTIDLEFLDFGLAFPTMYIYTKGRNYGLFREPGVYQFFLLLGLYLNNYRVDWERKWPVWVVNAVLAVTMMSTLATGGVIEMALLLVLLFLDKKWYRQKIGRIALAAGLLLGVAGFAVLTITKPPLYWSLYLMVAKLFTGEQSLTDRVGSLAVNLSFFLQNPLFGGRIADILFAIDNNTSSTTVMYAIFGILGGTVHVAGWCALVWDKERFVLWNLGLLTVLLMSFNTQNLITNPYLWIFPMMALTERLLPMVDSRRKRA